MSKVNKLIILLYLSSISYYAVGGVNRNNGNFYVSFTDLIIQDSVWEDLEITRTYNSKSTYNGLFAYGWGFLFETYLILTPENTVVIRSSGGGGKKYFESEFTNDESIKTHIDLIIEAQKKKNFIKTPEEEVEQVNKLTSRLDLRTAYYDKYSTLGYMDYTEHHPGIMYYSQGCGCIGEAKPGFSYVISTEEGYQFYDYQTGKVKSFDKEGRMVGLASMEDLKLNLKVYYTTDNKLERIESYNGNIISFKLDSNNRIVEIASSQSSQTANYWYKGRKLVLSKDLNGDYHSYEYDKAANLTKLVYNPKRNEGVAEDAQIMIYEPKTYFISKIVFRDGSFYKYTYGYGDTKQDYFTNESQFDKDSILSNELEEWWFRKANDHGKRWTYKKIDILNGDSITRIFHEISRKPLVVTNSEGTYNFSYDPQGLLLSAQTPTGKNFIVSYNDNNDITSIQLANTIFGLVKAENGYSKVILPDNNVIPLPINNFDGPELGKYKDQLKEAKELFILSFYEVL